MKEENSPLEELGLMFLIFLVIGSIFEIGLLIFAYVNADKVECNLLWCNFIIEEESTNYYSSSSECYVNNIKINCSDFPSKDYAHFYNDGKFEMNGVCPGVNDNKTIEDCIREITNE